MIPHIPNVVVASWSPFAHWASTIHKFGNLGGSEKCEEGVLTSVPVFLSNLGLLLRRCEATVVVWRRLGRVLGL